MPVAAVGPLKAIDDLPRSGRPPELTEASWLIGEACAQPKDRGYPHELWTLRLLATHARCYGPLAGHARLAELARILYVIGDLFRVGKATDEQQRTALKDFERALKEPMFAQKMG